VPEKPYCFRVFEKGIPTGKCVTLSTGSVGEMQSWIDGLVNCGAARNTETRSLGQQRMDVLLGTFLDFAMKGTIASTADINLVPAKVIGLVFQLPLDEAEDRFVLEFLEKSSHPSALDYLVVYQIGRSRFTQAISASDSIRDKMDTESAYMRTALLHNIKMVLPVAQQALASYNVPQNMRPAPVKESISSALPVVTKRSRNLLYVLIIILL
jgi:hypothetical protein